MTGGPEGQAWVFGSGSVSGHAAEAVDLPPRADSRGRLSLHEHLSRAKTLTRDSGSNPHGHDDVAILVVVALGGAKLAGGLRIFQFEPDFIGTGRLEEVDQVDGVEADGEGLAVVGGFDGILGLAGLG